MNPEHKSPEPYSLESIKQQLESLLHDPRITQHLEGITAMWPNDHEWFRLEWPKLKALLAQLYEAFKDSIRTQRPDRQFSELNLDNWNDLERVLMVSGLGSDEITAAEMWWKILYGLPAVNDVLQSFGFELDFDTLSDGESSEL